MKQYKRCERTLALSEFHKNKAKRDGLAIYCKSCCNASTRSHYQRNRDAYLSRPTRFANRLWSSYRLTLEAWEAMLERQGGLCACCKTAPATHVDHDHSCCSQSGKSCGRCVRGIVCHSCNTLVGKIETCPVEVAQAVAYIQDHTLASGTGGVVSTHA